MQSLSETEVPLYLWLQTIYILEFIRERARLVGGYLAIAKWPHTYLHNHFTIDSRIIKHLAAYIIHLNALTLL